jgi:3'-phosphoadenosine 5'-phosphosulfate sulfotransferase (PAPS reductase)/FAD synthetase
METATAVAPSLRDYDWVISNSSAGKDSAAMLDVLAEQAKSEGILDRLVVVHADLGKVEWPGTRELAERQARRYGLRFEVVRRKQGDLLQYVEKRGRWPSPAQRYCTSDMKWSPVMTLFTRLTAETRGRDPGKVVKLLNCLGLRAEESPARAKQVPFQLDQRASNGKRAVYRWLPIHDWTTEQVWARIKSSDVESHPAYSLGMPRLSCCFCIFVENRWKIGDTLGGKSVTLSETPFILSAYGIIRATLARPARPAPRRRGRPPAADGSATCAASQWGSRGKVGCYYFFPILSPIFPPLHPLTSAPTTRSGCLRGRSPSRSARSRSPRLSPRPSRRPPGAAPAWRRGSSRGSSS